MEIYLIRHTTPLIDNGICYGQSDIDIASTWKEEFDTIKSKLPSAKEFNVISSPLKRCALLARSLSTNISFDDRLKELDFGDWELKAWSAISEEELNPWMKDFVNATVPNGESYTQLNTRIQDFMNILLTSKDNQNLYIVTHAGPMRIILSSLLNIDLKNSFKIKIDYGDVFHLRIKDGHFKLISEISF